MIAHTWEYVQSLKIIYFRCSILSPLKCGLIFREIDALAVQRHIGHPFLFPIGTHGKPYAVHILMLLQERT